MISTLGKESFGTSGCSSIRVYPSTIAFDDVEVDVTYYMKVSIQNVSNIRKRVRVIPPLNRAFRLNYTLEPGLAPGLEQFFEVEFMTKEAKDFSDALVIQTDNERIEIPVNATIPAPRFEFETAVDFGVVVSGQPQAVEFPLANTGSLPGQFSFAVSDNQQYSISPAMGQLFSGEQVFVKVNFFGKESGPFRDVVDFNVEGERKGMLDISATVVESSVQVIFAISGGVVNKLNFGTMFFDQKRRISAVVVNSSPQSCSFVTRCVPKEDSRESEDEDEEEIARKLKNCPVTAIPAEGSVEPYGRLPVIFEMRALKKESTKGFKAAASDVDEKMEYSCKAIVEVIETEQVIGITCQGLGVPAHVELTEKKFVFGECPVNDYLDMMTSVKNVSDDLPITYSIDTAAHFTIRPASGKLKPLESRNIIVSFNPRQMGTFSYTLYMSVLDGAMKIPLRVSGTASTLGPKKKILGGPSLVKDDFARPLKFTQPVRFRPAAQKNGSLSIKIRDSSSVITPRHQDLLARTDHKRKYDMCIRQGRDENEETVERLKYERQFSNDTDIGIIPGEGLDSPRMEMPKSPLSLQLEQVLGRRQRAAGKGPTVKFDENRLLRKKFKPAPTTPAEAHDCDAVLSPKQLISVITGPKVLDFGEVSVMAEAAKSFFVTNNLETHIIVTIPFEREELKMSNPSSQVLPPGSTAGFDIILYGESAQTLQQTVFFTINNHHRLKFLVYAEMIPIQLELSASTLNFRFSDHDLDSEVTENVLITNTSAARAEFGWKNLHESFRVSPIKGFIEPFKTLPVSITYNSTGGQNEVEAELNLDVVGGIPRWLSCRAQVNESKCMFSAKAVEFGTIPVGLRNSKTVRIKNTSPNNSVFNVMESIPGINVTPARGRVAAGSSQDIVISLKPMSPQAYDFTLVFNIRGGGVLKLLVKAKAEVPSLFLTEGDFNFGDVYVHGNSRIPVLCRNRSAIAAFMYVDFFDRMEFEILNCDGETISDMTEGPITVVSNELTEGDSGRSMHLSDDEHDEDGDADSDIDDEDDDAKSQDLDHGKRYKLNLAANSSVEFLLSFSPMEVAIQEFEFPIAIPGVSADDAQLSRKIVANALKCRLSLSQMQIDFRNRVVVKKELKSVPYLMEINLTSKDEESLAWRWDKKILDSVKGAFTVEPSSGKLDADEIQRVTVCFTPTEAISYSYELPLYIGTDTRPYTQLSLKGIGIHPMLSFDQREIILPPVPLGFNSSVLFHILNDGYERLELRYKLPTDSERVPLEITFPEGMTVSRSCQQLPVMVYFTGKKPTSFTAKIDFFDNDGNRFSIPVSGTSDNSLCTVYPFLYGNRETHKYEAEADNDPIKLVERSGENSEGDDSPRGAPSIASGMGAATEITSIYARSERIRRTVFSKRNMEKLKEFLNVNVLKNPVQDAVSEFVRRNGAPLFEIVGFLSGKEVAGKVATFSTSKKEFCKQIMGQYDELLSFLKSRGALLNDIRPEFLVKYDDYLKIISFREEESLANGLPLPTQQQRKLSEKRFLYRAYEAWMCIIYQVVKVFLLNRVTLRSFKSTDGIPPSVTGKADPSLVQSNVFSVSECILLKWLSYHYNAVHGVENQSSADDAKVPEENEIIDSPDKPEKEKERPFRVINFDKDLRDARAFAAVLANHIPSTAKRLANMKHTCTTVEDIQHNASVFVATARDVGLEYVLKVESFTRADAREFLLFSWYLYQNLPQYLAKTTIEFQCELLRPTKKFVELSNPSAKTLDYEVRIEGSPTFSVENPTVRLAPSSTTSLEVCAISRFTKPSEGRLVLLGRRVGTYTPATLVFDLNATVTQRRPIRVFDVESPVYAMKMIDIAVENPFRESGRFSMIMSQKFSPMKLHSKLHESRDSGTLPDAFWVKNEVVPIKGKETLQLSVQFLPFLPGVFDCQIVFLDERVGEFSYAVQGTAALPECLGTVSKMQCEQNAVASTKVDIPLKNVLAEKALEIVSQRYKLMKVRRKTSPVPPLDRDIPYTVECASSYFSTDKTFTLAKKGMDARRPSSVSDKGAGGKSTASMASGGSLSLEFHPSEAGVYRNRVILASSFDIRVYEVIGKAMSDGSRASLDFICPAGQKITQEIPIKNTSDAEWKIDATLIGEYFSGTKEVRVPRGGVKNFTLVFAPQWICNSAGELVLTNATTGEKMMFSLNGVAEEPLASSNVEIKCKAREKLEYKLDVDEVGGGPVYSVEIDHPFVYGDEEYDATKGPYMMNVIAGRGGKYSGVITFTAPGGRYSWYTRL